MNAKELILKKINADTNWVDIYTSGVILGEDINIIGDFMTSQVINDFVSKYNTSAFDTEYVGTKIDFIKKAIASETDSNKITAYNELLRRVYIAEELRIMGKILKINQGMPTNFSDLQQYISSIEEYIESRLNHVNLENYQNTISQFAELKKQLGLSEELTKEEMNMSEVANALKQIKKAKEQMTSNWIYFNLVKFVQDKEYARQMDAMYEGVKVTFNILNTLRNSPHFSEMFNVLGLNNTILTSLSKRNLIERTIWNNAAHKSSRGQKVIYKKLNSTERSTLKTLVDDTLADTWIKTNIRNSDGSPVRIIWTANEKSNAVTFDGGFDYKLFIKYIETELIPRLRNNGLVVNGRTINTADNAFIKHLTFGKDRDGNTIFRLPYNMTQIDKNPGIQMEYEKILSAFGQLRGIILDSGLSIVDMFYLYNLIIHKDKINSRYSLTRLFEDLIASDGGEQLLVFKFNEWLETVNEQEIVGKVLGNWGAVHSNDNIGNSNTSYSSLVITPKFDADKTATIKARISNKFIGFGPENGSTYYYAQQAGSSANTGNYTAQDVIFVSVPGKRGDAQIRKQYQDQTIREAIKALEARATLITDSAEYLATSDYNEGEHRLAQNLQYLGYQYETIVVDGYQIGKWTNPKNDDPIDISKDAVAEELVTIGFNNTDERVDNSEKSDTVEENLSEVTLSINTTPVYQTTPSKQSKLIEVVRQANEKGIKGLHVVYQSDLVNEDIYIRSANGFVRNGEIYINVDRAGDDTVIHEFGHLYLADAKNNNRLAYYALLEKVKDTELWKRMRTWAAYANKIGSDFDEEILATMIGEYYKSGFENYEYKSLVKEALELVDPAFIELLNSEILPNLGDTFITNYHFQQKVATWKSKLVSDNILKENCL